MGSSLRAVNILLHHTILENTDRSEDVQCLFVARINAVKHKAHNDFLPGRSTFVPKLGLLQIDNIANVLHDTMKRPRCENLVLVVIGDSDTKLRVTIIHRRAEIVTIFQRELVGVTSSSSVCDALVSFLRVDQYLVHLMCVNSSLPPSKSLRYLA